MGHSAAFSFDGEVLIFGHEPGGGTQPRCAATGTVLPGGTVQTDDHKSFFFYDTDDGALLGKWVLPRPQTVTENCTLHNLNVVPTGKRDVLVHGSYQSSIGVLDFSDPAAADEIAYADPALRCHPAGREGRLLAAPRSSRSQSQPSFSIGRCSCWSG
jgi:hypothetical protein